MKLISQRINNSKQGPRCIRKTENDRDRGNWASMFIGLYNSPEVDERLRAIERKVDVVDAKGGEKVYHNSSV